MTKFVGSQLMLNEKSSLGITCVSRRPNQNWRLDIITCASQFCDYTRFRVSVGWAALYLALIIRESKKKV